MFDFKSKKILTIGDLILDVFCVGSVNRISPEAPIPIYSYKGQEFSLGGVGNLAKNLAAAGQSVSVLSVVGSDISGQILRNLLNHAHIPVDMIYVLPNYTTSTKYRLVAQHNQQFVRIDNESPSPVSKDVLSMMEGILQKIIQSFDVVVISDYMKGLMQLDFTQKIIRLCECYGIKVIIDVKDKDYKKYENAYLIKPKEALNKQLSFCS